MPELAWRRRWCGAAESAALIYHFWHYFAVVTTRASRWINAAPTSTTLAQRWFNVKIDGDYRIMYQVLGLLEYLTLLARRPYLYVRNWHYCRRQILTYKDGRRAEKIPIFTIVVDPYHRYSKTFMMISNWKTLFILHGLDKNNSSFWGLSICLSWRQWGYVTLSRTWLPSRATEALQKMWVYFSVHNTRTPTTTSHSNSSNCSLYK